MRVPLIYVREGSQSDQARGSVSCPVKWQLLIFAMVLWSNLQALTAVKDCGRLAELRKSRFLRSAFDAA